MLIRPVHSTEVSGLALMYWLSGLKEVITQVMVFSASLEPEIAAEPRASSQKALTQVSNIPSRTFDQLSRKLMLGIFQPSDFDMV